MEDSGSAEGDAFSLCVAYDGNEGSLVGGEQPGIRQNQLLPQNAVMEISVWSQVWGSFRL